MEFTEFPKISRWNREVIITEKLDGTNAQVLICSGDEHVPAASVARVGDLFVYAGSRNRFINIAEDNAGFAKWVFANADELVDGLGAGLHFGEWWGQGIQRNYGLKEKRFSLFNVHRWEDDTVRPKCCHVVPVLEQGVLGYINVLGVASDLLANGSRAAPGFMKPEGIVIFHTHSNTGFKYTFDKNDGHKGGS